MIAATQHSPPAPFEPDGATVESDRPNVLLNWPKARPALAIWRRKPSDAVTAAARDLAAAPEAAEQRFSWRPDSGPVDVTGFLSALDPRHPEAGLRALADDAQNLMIIAAHLAQSLRDELKSADLTTRLERITGDGCRLFHVDRLSARLICTWIGPGTEWLPEGSFDRAGLGCGCNDHVLDPRAARQIPTGAVTLLRGDLCSGHEGAGLVHRSPPAQPGKTRLLMAVDFR